MERWRIHSTDLRFYFLDSSSDLFSPSATRSWSDLGRQDHRLPRFVSLPLVSLFLFFLFSVLDIDFLIDASRGSGLNIGSDLSLDFWRNFADCSNFALLLVDLMYRDKKDSVLDRKSCFLGLDLFVHVDFVSFLLDLDGDIGAVDPKFELKITRSGCFCVESCHSSIIVLAAL